MNMKKALVSLALLALCASAQAQFTFTKVDGKTVSSQKSPDCKWQISSGTIELYFTWEKDRVKTYEVQYENNSTMIYGITESYIYYADFDAKKLDGYDAHGGSSFCYQIKLKGDKKIPCNNYYKARSYGGMYYDVITSFPNKKEADAFVSKVVDNALEMSLDLDYVAPPQLVIEKYEQEAKTPAKLKYAEITLVNDSDKEIRLSYMSSPDANSSRTITIAAKSNRYLKGDIGGQIYWMKLKPSGLYGRDKIAIDKIIASMHETKIILAK
jgi:hypothetical protein